MPTMDPRNRVTIVAGGLHSMARRRPTTQGFFVDLYAVLSRIPILGPLVFEPLGRVLRLTVTTPVFAWGSNMGPSQLGVAGISGSQVPVSVGSDWGGRPGRRARCRGHAFACLDRRWERVGMGQECRRTGR